MDQAPCAPARRQRLRRAGRIALAVSLVGAVAGALAPQPVMAWLRTMVPGFAVAWDWLDASLPWINPLHVIAFAWVAMLWRLCWPEQARSRMPVMLVAIGIACEALQKFVPGREPRVTDVLSDVLGIALGMLLANAVRLSRTREPTRS